MEERGKLCTIHTNPNRIIKAKKHGPENNYDPIVLWSNDIE